MDDTESTVTSLDENTENYLDNPTRDILTEGIMGLLKPTVDQLDERIRATRLSQADLKQQLDVLHEQVKEISELQKSRLDLDTYLKKIVNCKHKCTVVLNILQTAQERLNKVHANVEKKKLTSKPLSEQQQQQTSSSSSNNQAEATLETDHEQAQQHSQRSSSKNTTSLDVKTGQVCHLETLSATHIDLNLIYEPAEDTFLLLDALEREMPTILHQKPSFIIEIGSGSGVVIASLAKYLNHTMFAVDINENACHATKMTCQRNNAPLSECLTMDLLSAFRKHMFDLIIFNPPYVVTDSDEIKGHGIERSWAGGINGREVIDRLLANVDQYLDENGMFVLLVLQENKPDEIVKLMKAKGFNWKLVNERKIRGEYLKVFMFSKISLSISDMDKLDG